MNKIGYLKGETCNRNGCKGVIEEHEKEGSCTCHISAPCSYCTTQTEFCPSCGWSAKEEQDEYFTKLYEKSSQRKIFQCKTEKELFDELKEGEFDFIRVNSGAPSVCKIKGKHPNIGRSEILKRLSLYECPHMPRFSKYTNTEFELTYFCD